ncbi:MAG: ATP-binding protein [Kamptonema sp. SIO4C4]|nr:ATP-binding protein [Kamptonema sp. SIO4C4]
MDFPKQTTLQVISDLEQLNHVLAWFDQSRPTAIAQKDWLQCQLALAEAFTNAVRHAHHGLPRETSITIEVLLWEKHLELKVWDQGPPFDLKSRLILEQTEADHHRGGGRGLAILAKIADDLQYSRTPDGHNCLSIVKQYSYQG